MNENENTKSETAAESEASAVEGRVSVRKYIYTTYCSGNHIPCRDMIDVHDGEKTGQWSELSKSPYL